MKVAIVTGASSGMGHATALTLQQQGYQVFAGARRIEKMGDLQQAGVNVFSLDVTSEESNQTFVNHVLQTTNNRVDVIVNSAGYGSYGALEDVSMTEAKRQFEVNVFGTMNLTQLILPTMRKQHSGKIINISSTGGQMYTPIGGWYYSSKHALEALSDTLRLEVKPFGIEVVIVEPGGTKTEWQDVAFQNFKKSTPENSAYKNLAKLFTATNSSGFKTSEDIAELILKIINTKNPKTRYQPSFAEKLMVIAARKLSYKMNDRIINRTVNSMLKKAK